MRFRDKLALSVAPIVLRLLIGLVFLWVGVGRLMDPVTVTGGDAAILANLGAFKPSGGPPASEPRAQKYSAADFPGPVETRRVYLDALMIHHAAYPDANASGEAVVSTWPGALAGGNAPVVLAWAAALLAIVGGGLILIGLLTRAWAALLTIVMFVALWLTQLGPAIQSGKTRLGILPDHPLYSTADWQDVLWQFTLLMAALTLALAGSGAWALDRTLFGKPGGGGHG
ncbi:MAG: DoxX family membrane protein [Phycisphaerales bacterium]